MVLHSVNIALQQRHKTGGLEQPLEEFPLKSTTAAHLDEVGLGVMVRQYATDHCSCYSCQQGCNGCGPSVILTAVRLLRRSEDGLKLFLPDINQPRPNLAVIQITTALPAEFDLVFITKPDRNSKQRLSALTGGWCLTFNICWQVGPPCAV